MTRRSPRGAENRGGEREKTTGSSRGGVEGGGELQQQMQAFSHYHALLSVKC